MMNNRIIITVNHLHELHKTHTHKKPTNHQIIESICGFAAEEVHLLDFAFGIRHLACELFRIAYRL